MTPAAVAACCGMCSVANEARHSLCMLTVSQTTAVSRAECISSSRHIYSSRRHVEDVMMFEQTAA